MRTRNAKRFAARLDPGRLKGINKKLILIAVVLGLASMIPLLAYGPLWSRASGTVAVSGLKTVIVIDEHKAIASDIVRLRQCHPWLICQNGKDHIDVVVLKRGQIPNHPTKAVVETDTDCAADAYGDSHCTNVLRLSDGREIEVRHDHNMQIYPCLTPGDTVEVEAEPSA